MHKIEYTTRYLSTKNVSDCFEDGKYNIVDKTITGNGFTSGYLLIPPTHSYQSNIIIVPNREVILSKRQKYKADLNPNKTKIGFIFGDADADKISFKDFDILMFVIDSFIDRIDYLKEYSSCVDKILIDEMHSVYIQSTFRPKLKNIDEVLSKYFRASARVSVTATPMLFQSVDITLYKKVTEHNTINVTENQKKSLERLKTLIAEDKKVIVATHNAQLIASLSKVVRTECVMTHSQSKTNEKNTLVANFKIGISLKKNLVERCTIKQDAESNLTIISSSGFEGFDVENGVNNVFIFEDRANDFSTFYFQNVLQIIGRSRKGVDYIEYCRNTHSKGRTHFDKEEMNKVVNSTRISFEKKMTDKNYYYIPKFYTPLLDKQTEGFIKDLTLDNDTYNLYDEKQKSDVNGVGEYNSYAKERGFDIVELNEGNSRVNFGVSKEKSKFKFIQLNMSYIRKYRVFNDIRLNIQSRESLDSHLKELRKYYRRKYYDNIQFIDISKLDIEDFILQSTNEQEKEIYKILASGGGDKNNRITELVNLYSKKYKEKKLIEYGGKYGNEDFKKAVEDFTINIEDRIVRLLMCFAQEIVKFPAKKRVWRDYNISTEISLFITTDLAKAFNIDTYEADIRTCNPRIIYAHCGLDLPEDFYGENKKNKKAINTLLNSLSKDYALRYCKDPKKEKNVLKKRRQTILENFKKYNIDEKVVEFLRTFWMLPADSLFNFCAYHEQKITNSLKGQLIDSFGKELFGFNRRHDSILIMGRYIKEGHIKAVSYTHLTLPTTPYV